MFTFNRVVKDEKNEAARRREITVEFINELEHVKSKMISFSINETAENIKKVFAQYLDELNYVPPAITDLNVPTETAPTAPTQAELDKQAWEANWAKLQIVDKLIAAQVLTGTETQVLALRKKVKDDFKVAYLA